MGAKLIGAHMPTAGNGIAGSIRAGKEIGCTAVQVFTKSPRMWRAVEPTSEKIGEFKKAAEETAMGALVSHDSYLINLADPREEGRQRGIEGLIGEITRCDSYGIPFVVSHMGAHMGAGEEEGLRLVIEGAKQVLDQTSPNVTLLMETTAGQGSSLNWKFEHLAAILEGCGNPDRLAICLDTCQHIRGEVTT